MMIRRTKRRRKSRRGYGGELEGACAIEQVGDELVFAFVERFVVLFDASIDEVACLYSGEFFV